MNVKDRAEEVQLITLLTVALNVQRTILIHAHAGLKNLCFKWPTCMEL